MMFGFGRKKDDAVVETVCSRLRPLFGLLEHRLERMPADMAQDPFVVGYVVNTAVIFAMIETNGKASTELRGRVSLAGLQSAFASLQMTQQQASASMHTMVGDPETKRGGDAADLVMGVMAGKTDRDSDPWIAEARAALASMPAPMRRLLGSDEKSALVHQLQEQIFFQPIEARYGR